MLETETFLNFLKAQEKPKLLTIDHDESPQKAVRFMVGKNYSQLPVIRKDKVVGVISYESLANSLYDVLLTNSKQPPKLRVKDLMEKVSKIYTREDDMLGILDTLANKSYVLIWSGNRVIDIITSYDVLLFFRTCTEGFSYP